MFDNSSHELQGGPQLYMGSHLVLFHGTTLKFFERAYWAVSKQICVPSIVMTISFLYPRHQIRLSVSRVIRELATGFHNIGDKMPPWGQPLYTIQVNVCT